MLSATELEQGCGIYWVYGYCSCGHQKSFLMAQDNLLLADVGFTCKWNGCKEHHSLNAMLKRKEEENGRTGHN